MQPLWAGWFTPAAIVFLELMALYPPKVSEPAAQSANSVESILRVYSLGVVRIEFREEKLVFGAIAPHRTVHT